MTANLTVDCSVEGVFEEDLTDYEAHVQTFMAAGFRGQQDQTILLERLQGPVLLVGLGLRAHAVADTVRTAAATAGRALRHLTTARCTLAAKSMPGYAPEEVARAAAEGVTLGAYHFAGYKSSLATRTRWLSALGPKFGDLESEGWAEGVQIGTAVNFTRDLVNTPANILTPTALADHAETLARNAGMGFRRISGAELDSGAFGGIAAVGRGSAEPACLVELTWGDPQQPPDLCLVGKGITYDSGGLSLKSPESQIGMKNDMGGAAAVLGAMMLVPLLAPSLRVKAVLPFAENMPGGRATRPGDVVTMRNGRTVEILNTDFEGRLVLGDALALAAESGPGAIIDLATLTYAATHALGERTAALLGSDQTLIERIERAAGVTGEPVWRLPMPRYLRPQILSQVADLKNFPGATTARTSTAAMFLREFVPASIPWAHLDLAGPAWSEEEYGVASRGATGYGVRLLGQLLRTYARG
ncbi:leucyl aminopeptidase [Arthrobacter sp. VKM Ac-2550]|uniref:leucyl aminopeptidase n=1 Tax=Crystallibacter permensis TaxID=1938888 RepID=UPI002225D0B4|nr:leucyl aminopeptidase [Arthrobacter sp. VKM Ac-2550]MCW2132358.1 leucyl aminopeptidase [Arthrobacter sp. VKM Ac-2550]